MHHMNWGILGCGGIAHQFSHSLKTLEAGHLLAGASRTSGRAAAFAAQHGVERIYTDYESLVADPDVDAIYIATTHNFHFENAKLCLEHGKHVLCEKPFTVNAIQTQALMDLARKNKCFLMEAIWTRFLPGALQLRERLAAGAIGEIRTVQADFCIEGSSFTPEHRLRNKALAGGALLDLGIYPLTFAAMVFGGHPLRVQSSVVLGDTGVDDRSFYLLEYAGGRHAQLSASFSHHAPVEAVIGGSEGYIRVPLFTGVEEFVVHRNDKDPEWVKLPYAQGTGFRFEIAHAMECIAAGKLESDIMPLAETLAIMHTMDTLRAQWKLNYPAE